MSTPGHDSPAMDATRGPISLVSASARPGTARTSAGASEATESRCGLRWRPLAASWSCVLGGRRASNAVALRQVAALGEVVAALGEVRCRAGGGRRRAGGGRLGRSRAREGPLLRGTAALAEPLRAGQVRRAAAGRAGGCRAARVAAREAEPDRRRLGDCPAAGRIAARTPSSATSARLGSASLGAAAFRRCQRRVRAGAIAAGRLRRG